MGTSWPKAVGKQLIAANRHLSVRWLGQCDKTIGRLLCEVNRLIRSEPVKEATLGHNYAAFERVAINGFFAEPTIYIMLSLTTTKQ